VSVAAEPTAPAEHGWYVYGVVEAAAASPPNARGIGTPAAPVVVGSLAALVSRVPLDEYGEEPVRARLEDPAWLEEKVWAHEEVLQNALQTGAVIPFRFLTLYRDEEELRRFLVERLDDLQGVLDGVRGMVELGVKAFVDRDRLEAAVARDSPAVVDLDAAIAQAESGRAYLLRRRRDQVVREECAQLLAGRAEELHGRLREVAADAAVNPVQTREVSGRTEEMLLNGAYLVPAGDAAFEATVAALAAEQASAGVALELTGPWPPYNFVPRDLGAR